jgi:2-desacetyl-2-hydroxyethyl bacteriochlorophyllide A dehydrogenase
MKTIRLERPGELARVDTADPLPPGMGEVRVRIRRVGICGTDYHAFRGRQPFFQYPRILGHELGVEIVDVGPDVETLNPGMHCTVEPYLVCGRCIACRAGRTNCCASLKCLGVHTDGGLRESIVVPAKNLHPSDRLTLDQLALVETLGIGSHAVDRVKPAANDAALVVGVGPIGLAVSQFAKLAGIEPIVLDGNTDRLAFARAAMGIENCIEAGDGDLERISQLTSGEMPSVVFDCTGNPASMERSFDLISQGGTLVLVGIVQADIKFRDPDFHRREATLLASRNSTAKDFRRIIGLIESGAIDTTPWITHRTSLDRLVDVFPTWLDPASRVVKGLVDVDE